MVVVVRATKELESKESQRKIKVLIEI